MRGPGIIPTADLPAPIAATLDFLPHSRRWEPGEFEEWLALFESACRVWYRLPSARSIEAVVRRRNPTVGSEIGSDPA